MRTNLVIWFTTGALLLSSTYVQAWSFSEVLSRKPAATITGRTEMVTSSTATKPKVAKVEQILKAYDANGALIFSASVQPSSSGERIATVTTSDKVFQLDMSADGGCIQMPDVKDCASLEECMMSENDECYDAFVAQQCTRSPSFYKGYCGDLLKLCGRGIDQYCDWYMTDCPSA